MDLAFLLVLPAALWVQSWYLLGFYANPRTLGMISAAVAVTLLAIVLFQDNLGKLTVLTPSDALLDVAIPLSIFILVWAIYAALMAGVYLWGMDTRSLGFYGLFSFVISALFAVYFFVGGELLDSGDINHVSWLLGVVAILLAVMSLLLFFYLALVPRGQVEPPSSGMRTATGWVYLTFSSAVAVLGGLLLLGLNPTL